MVRIAILGAGSIVQNAHLPAWQAQPDAEVVAIVDIRPDVAERVAREHGIPRWATDYHEVLADPAVDVVDLCLPHHLHAPVAIDCLRAGKHLLIEKPIALDLDSARQMARAADEHGRVLMVGENWRYAPATVEAERLIRGGAVGTPFLLKAAMEFDFRPQEEQGNWRLQRDQAGGGVLLDSGIHTMAVARAVMGEMTEVTAFRGKQVWPELAPSEDTLGLLARFADGSIGVLDFTWRAQREHYYFAFEVLGTEATVSFDIGTGELALTRDGQREERPQPRSSGFQEEIRHLLDCLRDGTRPRTAGLEEARTLAAILAAYRSVESRRTEPVEAVEA